MEAIVKLIYEGNYTEALQHLIREKEKKGNNDTLAILEAAAWQGLDNREAMWNAISQGLAYNPQNYELYYMLGDYYASINKQQAWLCFENAKFYCKEEEDCKMIEMRMQELEQHITPPAKAAIIILSYNNLDMTRNCITSIRENCISESYELIVIDNASWDESVTWLKTQTGMKVICNQENLGFPKACNQGIQLAEPESDIFLLNNDTLMMPNALFWLRMGLYEAEEVGACGSVSNSAANYQKIKETYDNVGGYVEYALGHNIPQKYPYEERMYLIGFAMLIKREAVNRVGLLDERFTPGNFEDTDYGVRLIQAGYRNRVCKNSFIFHWGGQAFGKKLEKYMALLKNNKRLFEEKWQRKYKEYSVIHTNVIEKIEVPEKMAAFQVLNLNCGYGMTMAKIQSEYPNAQCYGVVGDVETTEIAKRYGRVVQGNIETMTFEELPEEFDYIIATEVLETLETPKHFMKRSRELLKELGSLLLLVCDMKHWTEDSLRALLKECGYQTDGVWYYGISGETAEVHQILIRAKKDSNHIQEK